MKTHFYLLEMDSEHFKWVTIGNTRQECISLLHRKWDANQKKRGGENFARTYPKNEDCTLEEFYGAWIRKVKVGGAYFDGRPVIAIAGQVPLADHACGVSGTAERLGDGHVVGGKRGVAGTQVVDDSHPRRVLPRQQRGPIG